VSESTASKIPPAASASSAALVSARADASAVATGEVGKLFVVFKVAGTDYALAADEVLQMESYTGATAVPGAPSFVVGVIQLRGRVVPVVDLRARFHHPPAEITLDSRVVVAERDGRAVALLADTAREVVRIAPSQAKAPPRLVDENGYVHAVVQLGGRTLLVLDFAKVVGDGLPTTPTAVASTSHGALAGKQEQRDG